MAADEFGSVAMDPAELAGMRATTETGFDDTAKVRRFVPAGESDFGNPTGSWVDGSAIPAMFVHTSSREVTVARDTQISDWFVRLPWNADVKGNDQIVRQTDGAVFAVLGPPSFERTHVRAQLTSVSG